MPTESPLAAILYGSTPASAFTSWTPRPIKRLIELTTPEQDLGVTQLIAVALLSFQLVAQCFKRRLALQSVEGPLENALSLLDLAIGQTLPHVGDRFLDFGAAEPDQDLTAQMYQFAGSRNFDLRVLQECEGLTPGTCTNLLLDEFYAPSILDRGTGVVARGAELGAAQLWETGGCEPIFMKHAATINPARRRWTFFKPRAISPKLLAG